MTFLQTHTFPETSVHWSLIINVKVNVCVFLILIVHQQANDSVLPLKDKFKIIPHTFKVFNMKLFNHTTSHELNLNQSRIHRVRLQNIIIHNMKLLQWKAKQCKLRWSTLYKYTLISWQKCISLWSYYNLAKFPQHVCPRTIIEVMICLRLLRNIKIVINIGFFKYWFINIDFFSILKYRCYNIF